MSKLLIRCSLYNVCSPVDVYVRALAPLITVVVRSQDLARGIRGGSVRQRGREVPVCREVPERREHDAAAGHAERGASVFRSSPLLRVDIKNRNL